MRRKMTVILLCCVLLLTGCGRVKDIAQNLFSGQKNDGETQSIGDPDPGAVAMINGDSLSSAEWFLYLEPVLTEAENMYGESLYSFTVDRDGTTLYQSLVDNTFENIVYIRVICSQAESLGVSLNEDELIDVSLRTDEYLERLSDAQKEKYSITAEVVKKVYSDNMLARKVYEHLTLNVDTGVDMNLVRRMNLQYMVISKTTIGEDELEVSVDEAELQAGREYMEQVIAEYRANDGVLSLFDVAGGENTHPVYEIVGGKADLSEKLSEKVAEAAFELPDRAISDIIETEDAYYVLCCAQYNNETETNKARIAIIEQRQEELFEESYRKWRNDAEVVKYTDLGLLNNKTE